MAATGLIAVAVLAGMFAAAGEAQRYASPDEKEQARTARLNTCLWEGPVGARGVFSDDPSTINVSNQFPDKAAVYWISRFSVKPGSVLRLEGGFPHSRYMSFNAYDGVGQPFTALADYEIKPDPGSGNPFRPGALRTVRKRSYTVKAIAGPEPAAGALPENTLYLGPAGDDGRVTGTIMYRVYVADRGYGIPGGAGLPKATLENPDGSELTGENLCAETDTPVRGQLRNPSISVPLFQGLVDSDPDPEAAPVRKTSHPKFETFFNSIYAILGSFKTAEEQAAMDATQKGGFYSTEHNRYVFAQVSREFGDLFVLRGKMPTTTATYEGQKRFGKKAQMRFFSICTGESPATGQTSDCAHDIQIPLDRKGYYNVVVSKKADRPDNAISKCGVTWLRWGAGDGFPGGRPGYGIVIVRNMLPAPWFGKSVFSVTEPGTETSVMGRYLPRGHYSGTTEYEKRKCAKPGYLPGK